MPLKVEAYLDNRGKLHQTLEAATVADLAHEVFGSAESMAPSLAQKVLQKRADIASIFAEYDAALNPETAACPIPNSPISKATTATTALPATSGQDSKDWRKLGNRFAAELEEANK